jgi:hypothetical protein
MKLRSFLILNAIMFIPFGIGMLTMPSFIFPMVGVDLDADGLVMASTVGSMLLSFGIICFFARNEDLGAGGMKAILTGNLVFHTIDSFLTGKGALTEVMNPMGFMFSSMHLVIAVGFLIFLLQASKLGKQKIAA